MKRKFFLNLCSILSGCAILYIYRSGVLLAYYIGNFCYASEYRKRSPCSYENSQTAYVKTTHIFKRPGTYFPVLKAQSSRTGTLDDIFIQCKNLDRVRVVVE